MLIGYMRVSTGEQSLDLQRDALALIGCERVYDDVCSGRAPDRPVPVPKAEDGMRYSWAAHRVRLQYKRVASDLSCKPALQLTGSAMPQRSFRVSDECLDDLNRIAEHLAQLDHHAPNQTRALAWAVARGIDAIEQGEKQAKAIPAGIDDQIRRAAELLRGL